MNNSFEKTREVLPRTETIGDNDMLSSNDLFRGKNLLIVILVSLLVLSFLGINLLLILGDFMQVLLNIFGPLVGQILSVFGYTTGTLLDKSEDVATSVAKTGIDIAGGTVDSIADILKNLSKDNVNQTSINQLDKTLGSGDKKPSNIFARKQPEPDESSGVIQKPITSDKSQWCLVGEYEGKRGCVEVNEASKCLSGQTFPTLQMCMHPTKAVYMHSHAAT